MEGTLIEQAFTLMIVGMITVFAVLGLVIAMGNALIRFVNKYVPEEEAPAPKAAAPASAAIAPDVKSAIELAVAKITSNKGRIEKIEKI
ncbi:MAG: OadG family transporter subunit [Paludibacteraceae bacterium]|jgi:oxaloacetate decarboxylase gamma subunit|nr:OadG family transporter subunit [Paludibacteraceae bacterium]